MNLKKSIHILFKNDSLEKKLKNNKKLKKKYFIDL